MFDPAITSFIVPIISVVIGTVVGWFFTRHKQNKEVDLLEVQEVDKAIDIWKTLAHDMRCEYEALHKTHIQVKNELLEVKQTVKQLTDELLDLKTYNRELLIRLEASTTP